MLDTLTDSRTYVTTLHEDSGQLTTKARPPYQMSFLNVRNVHSVRDGDGKQVVLSLVTAEANVAFQTFVFLISLCERERVCVCTNFQTDQMVSASHCKSVFY